VTALAIEPAPIPVPTLRLVEPPPPTVFELGRLRLVDLQAHYIQLFPLYDQDLESVRLSVQDMSREQLVAHLLEGRR
jgi:hypothetical protein